MTVGRLVLPALRWREETGFAHEVATIDEALGFGAGGFILFGGTAGAVRDLTTMLREQSGRPLLIAADLERGAGQQVLGLAELPPPLALASRGDDGVIRGAGLLTASQALGVGINWVLAPVADLDLAADNPIVQTRSFGADPAEAATAVANWVAGCEAGGAMACVKHFPGHGRTVRDSHDEVPVVAATLEELEAADLVPFRAAISAGVSAVMTAHVAFPALDPSGRPATRSPAILSLLRERLGHDGLIVSDALMMEGAMGGLGSGGAAVEALAAGVDLLLYPDDPGAAVRALDAAPDLGGRIDAALAQYELALRRVEGAEAYSLDDLPGSAEALAHWLLSNPPARGTVPRLRAPVDLVVVDDDLGGRYPPSSPGDLVARALTERGVPVGPGGSRLVLVLAEPRASKGRAGLGAASRERLEATGAGADLVVLFGHPRLVAEVPPGPPVLVAWHRQALMQHALARWIEERLG